VNERPLVLIVEDDDAFRERLARAFEGRGFEVQTAASVADAEASLSRETPEWLSSGPAAAAYEELKGKTAFSAREAVVAMLRESGDLEGEPTPTQRMANFYEKGDKPLEIVATRQWYITNGGRGADLARPVLRHAPLRSLLCLLRIDRGRVETKRDQLDALQAEHAPGLRPAAVVADA